MNCSIPENVAIVGQRYISQNRNTELKDGSLTNEDIGIPLKLNDIGIENHEVSIGFHFLFLLSMKLPSILFTFFFIGSSITILALMPHESWYVLFLSIPIVTTFGQF